MIFPKKRLIPICLFFLFTLVLSAHAEQSGIGKYSRIISLGPSITESLFAIGCGDLIVGVSDYCIYPPEALEKPRVGGILNPNMERYAILRPDLVIFRGKLDKVKDYCLSRNIDVMETEMDSIASISETVNILGAKLGQEEKAGEVIENIRKELDEVSREVEGLSRPKVFLCVGRTPGGLSSIYTCSKTSFVSQVLKIAGGENVFSDIPTAYPEISKESLIRQAPDIILEMRPAETFSKEQMDRMKEEWALLRTLPAVRNGRIHIMTQDYLLVPGPRVGRAARAIADVIHSNPAGGEK
ncbi:periplasmic binding protein [Desulfatibacillum aliphaticivorans]|uniref:Periplasmic binding protein n=1 Tax=Desulfatibacillum aliphaticivorans TaxID=218208 RepID=B8FHP7_DESAL|nr:helical backbone metal receptor [Desulfatibacillum aliphaticivorans]ACL02464.1 periplasmic binding protein [Desulfatibacillum aliphaticivorans]